MSQKLNYEKLPNYATRKVAREEHDYRSATVLGVRTDEELRDWLRTVGGRVYFVRDHSRWYVRDRNGVLRGSGVTARCALLRASESCL